MSVRCPVTHYQGKCIILKGFFMKSRFYALGFVIGLMMTAYFAIGVYADHTWSSYHWELSGTVLTLDVGNNVSSNWQSYFDEAIRDWNVSPVVALNPVAGNGSADCSPTVGQMEVCNANYGSTGWLGLAQIWLDSGNRRRAHIIQGVAKMNDSYFDVQGGTYNTPAWRDVVMCQEIGHIFGIAHNDEDFSTTTGTCMDYSTNPEPNRQPDAHDYELLLQIYGHSHGTSDGGDGGGSGGNCRGGPKQCPANFAHVPQQALNAPAEWGQLVSSSQGHSVYVRNLGNGITVITDVLWVDGAGPGN